MNDKFLDYASVIRDGNDIDYKDISLCDLRNHVPWYRGKKNGIYKSYYVNNNLENEYNYIDGMTLVA